MGLKGATCLLWLFSRRLRENGYEYQHLGPDNPEKLDSSPRFESWDELFLSHILVRKASGMARGGECVCV